MKLVSVFSQQVQKILSKDTNKRARNTKLVSVFSQRAKVSSRFTSKIQISEREISSLLEYFSASAEYLTLNTRTNI